MQFIEYFDPKNILSLYNAISEIQDGGKIQNAVVSLIKTIKKQYFGRGILKGISKYEFRLRMRK
jgi:hypothetical protein